MYKGKISLKKLKNLNNNRKNEEINERIMV